MTKLLAEHTIEELTTKQKTLKMAVGFLIGTMIVMIGALVAIMLLKGSRAILISLSALPVVFIPILIANKKSLKEIEAELKKRKG